MKAPLDKRNDTIQIIVTRACDLFNCSNCTQLLPFRQDVLHMSLGCFERAVKSVVKWPGVVALFGGNPCCHPSFPELCDILSQYIPEQRRRGIWSNNFLGQGEVVRKTFYPSGRFNLNAHGDAGAALEMERHCPTRVIPKSKGEPSWHTPILLDRRDFGISEETWIRAREECDINTHWSSAIVEHNGRPYAYFCEVAAALDGVRGEMNGIPAYDDWWDEPMERFEHQVDACCDRGCGVPLRRLGHLDRDDTYDLSPSWQEIKFKGRIGVAMHYGMPEESCKESTDYMRIRA